MDLAFIFTYLILRCLRSEVEICALSISIRHKALGALGLPVAALTGVENSKGEIASIAVKNAIGSLSGLKSVAMFEDGKSQGSPRKLSTRRQKMAEVSRPTNHINVAGVPRKSRMAEDRGFEPLKGCPLHAFQACALGRYANPPWRTLALL